MNVSACDHDSVQRAPWLGLGCLVPFFRVHCIRGGDHAVFQPISIGEQAAFTCAVNDDCKLSEDYEYFINEREVLCAFITLLKAGILF